MSLRKVRGSSEGATGLGAAHPLAGEGDFSEGLLEAELPEDAESEPDELDDCEVDPDVDLDLLEGISCSRK